MLAERRPCSIEISSATSRLVSIVGSLESWKLKVLCLSISTATQLPFKRSGKRESRDSLVDVQFLCTNWYRFVSTLNLEYRGCCDSVGCIVMRMLPLSLSF
jgi:hypothetical protein